MQCNHECAHQFTRGTTIGGVLLLKNSETGELIDNFDGSVVLKLSGVGRGKKYTIACNVDGNSLAFSAPAADTAKWVADTYNIEAWLTYADGVTINTTAATIEVK